VGSQVPAVLADDKATQVQAVDVVYQDLTDILALPDNQARLVSKQNSLFLLCRE